MNDDKPVVWLWTEVSSPPLSRAARLEAGFLLRMLQAGERLGMPQSRSMSSIGRRCHELRINDGTVTWRIIYRIDEDAIVVVHVFSKKSRRTPRNVLELCRRRLQRYDETRNEDEAD
ncbi:MAG: type II toxin-antitoxin system RelE/ParE family toxin [Gemmatimonadales bacterium]|jgi:phage-related protein